MTEFASRGTEKLMMTADPDAGILEYRCGFAARLVAFSSGPLPFG